MDVRTGYFAKVKKYEDSGYLVVSIARTSPKFYNGLFSYHLAPTSKLLWAYKNGEVDEDEYTRQYMDYLDEELVVDEVSRYMKLAETQGKCGVVFVCWERADAFCHRHLLAKYLNHVMNLDVTELVV